MKHCGRGKIIFLTIAGVLLVVLAAFWWLFILVFDDSRVFHRCSLAYWILVLDSVRRLPLDYCTGPAHYRHSIADGLSPH